MLVTWGTFHGYSSCTTFSLLDRHVTIIGRAYKSNRSYVPFKTANIASGPWSPPTGCSLPNRPRRDSFIPTKLPNFS
ncbi:hypothetical protein B0J17DRAFT_635717 [Rhizoctonia solani]|nr:hypothetical protein B0J17DRAFT_635717 [Rhizoctonia solani]